MGRESRRKMGRSRSEHIATVKGLAHGHSEVLTRFDSSNADRVRSVQNHGQNTVVRSDEQMPARFGNDGKALAAHAPCRML